VFFVEARYHHSPKRAADQVRYIAHREEGCATDCDVELALAPYHLRGAKGHQRAVRA
jgi:hypothetical protein